MTLFNLAKNTIVADDIIVLKNLFEKASGLIGKSAPRAVFVKTRWGIHTFGMKFPIDVIVCDKEMRVFVLRENLVPNRMFFWNPRFPYILELPSGMIKTSVIEIGDRLEINKH